MLQTMPLLPHYLFRSVSPHDFPRIWLQLALFQKYVEPLWPTLRQYPRLFWALPAPFDATTNFADWRMSFVAMCSFVKLLQRGKVETLEGALITWFWPEIVQDTRLLDVVSARTSCSFRSRKEQLSTAMPLFAVIAAPYAQAMPRPQSTMGRSICYRYGFLQKYLHQCQSKKGRKTGRETSSSSILLLSEILKKNDARAEESNDKRGGSKEGALTYNVVQDNKDAARRRKMQKVVNWTAEGMELPVRGDYVDGVLPTNYKHFVPCQKVSPWLGFIRAPATASFVLFLKGVCITFVAGKLMAL